MVLTALSQTPWQVWRGTPPFPSLYAPPNTKSCIRPWRGCSVIPGRFTTLAAMFFGVLTIFVSSFIKKCDAHATVHYEQPSTYYNELFPSDKERYDKSYNVCMDLEHTGIRLAYLTQHWVDDVSKWPVTEISVR